MGIAQVVERVERIAAVRADASADPAAISVAMRASTELKAWLAAGDSELARRLKGQVSFPEKTIADCTRGTLNDGLRATERAETLSAVPEFADALDNAAVIAGHIDAITKRTKGLDDTQRAELYERAAGLVDVAAVATVAEFGKRLDLEVRAIRRDEGLARLERQQRATSLRTWVDGEGMFCYSGRTDPVSGVVFAARIDAETQALFAEGTPPTCPTDPIDKQRHLAGLTLNRIITSTTTAAMSGRPEYVVVVDSSQPDGAGGPAVDWGIPVEVPTRVLADMMSGSDVSAVVVRNGVVLHAPGTLDLGRSSRLANRAQRRALRALYATCAIPGCTVRYHRTKLHHVHWWEHGGLTDLANLLPVCQHHHTKIHDHGWIVELGPNRQLTIRFPDGNILTNGPPRRNAA